MKKKLILLFVCAFGMIVNAQNQVLKKSMIVENQQVDNQKGDWLLNSHWTQDYPYNSMCPIDPVTNSPSYAGCPAIAMGQIINYLGMTNGKRFDDNDDYHHGYAGRNYDIDDDWEELGFPSFPALNAILDEIDEAFQSGQSLTKDQEAAIVFACGTACTQVYTSSGSGTFQVEQAYEAFRRFGFDDCVLFKEPTDEMHALLQENLRDGYPAHLAVESPDLQSGHNVVVDGYRESDGKYHMNFGYGGAIDGWYSIPDPNFYYGLTKLEGIILNIIPKAKTIENLYVSSTGYAMWNALAKPGCVFSIKLNDNVVGTTDGTTYQFDVDNLQAGATYTASVSAVENGNVGEYSTTSWVYIPCERYNGVQDFDAWQTNGDVHLEWLLPEGSLPGGTFDPTWMYYDDGNCIANIGGGDIPGGHSASMYWGIRIPAEDLEEYESGYLTKIALWTNNCTLGPFEAKIYKGFAPTEEYLELSMQFLPNIQVQMTEIELSAPVALDGGLDLWIMLSQSGASTPASVCANTGDANGRYVSTDGETWTDLATLGLDYTFMVRGLVSPEPTAKQSREMLYDQTQFVTDEGVMTGGADASNLQEGQVTFGAYANYGNGVGNYLVADDFDLYGNSTINEIEVYGYQVESSTTSTFTGLYMQIYKGNPNGAGQVVWGDMATNMMTSTAFTNCYRTQYLEGTARPIMSVTASNLNIELDAGHYWLVWSMTGDETLNGPYAAPVAIAGHTVTGNAMQKAPDGWLNLTDSQCYDPYGLAMKISGVNHGGGSQYDGKALGTMIYRDDEFLTFFEVGEELHQSYIDEDMGGGNHEYSVRVVYDGNQVAAPAIGNYYAMSCPETIDFTPNNISENNVNQFVIFPNPTNDIIHFSLDGKETDYSIYNVAGQKVMNGTATESVDVSNLNKGLYIIKIGEKTARFVVE